MRTSRLMLASVLAAVLAFGAWYVWHDGGAADAHANGAEPSPKPAPGKGPPASAVVEQRSSLLTERSSPAPAPARKPASFIAHRQQIELSGYEAAGQGIEEARARLAQLGSPADRLLFLRGMFTRFGEGHALELVDVFKELSKPAERQAALLTLVELWNPEGIASAVHRNETDGGLYGPEGSTLLRLTDEPIALALARTLPNLNERAEVLGELAWREVSRNPAQALSYGDGIEGGALSAFQQKVVDRWAQLDATAAWDWVQQHADPAVRDALQLAALTGMEPSQAAQRWAQTTNDVRAQGLDVVAARWGTSDTQAALNWANSLSNPGEKDNALAAIHGVAPVGIGAVLTTNPEGYPVIRKVVPGGAASGLPQLAEGASIAAVRDAQGNVIDLKGKTLEEAVGLIRGKPGTPLTLEVIPPGGSAANRQVVVVTRRQLLFKR